MSASPPPVVLAISSGCAHCSAMTMMLVNRVKDGRLCSLHIVSLDADPAWAKARGIRSVPWIEIGDMVFDGAMGEAELDGWLRRWCSDEGRQDYVNAQLSAGRLQRITEMVNNDITWLRQLLRMSAETEAPLQVRIGISAVVESLEGRAPLRQVMEELLRLSGHENAAVRADAAHYLGLSHDAGARPRLQALLEDKAEAVRDIAADALLMIDDQAPQEPGQSSGGDG